LTLLNPDHKFVNGDPPTDLAMVRKRLEKVGYFLPASAGFDPFRQPRGWS
jgi:hypothetical protein